MSEELKRSNEIREKIRKGLDLSFQKLVLQKSLTDESLVFSKDGRIIEVKAKDLLATLQDNKEWCVTEMAKMGKGYLEAVKEIL